MDMSKIALAERLSQYTINPNDIQKTQLAHRIDILQEWLTQSKLTSLAANSAPRVLEIGCGQGDMTVVLAHAIFDTSGRVDAIDPAPLTYGSPFTLGESQTAISRTPIGTKIQWIQRDPLEYLSDVLASPAQEQAYDFIILAHSLFYLPSETYFRALMRKIRDTALYFSTQSGTQTALFVAEWGMRGTPDASNAHIHAVNAQAAFPIPEANVRTVLEPHQVLEIASEQGWSLQGQSWISGPEVEDGNWEVDAARTHLLNYDGSETEKLEAKKWLQKIDDAVSKTQDGRARSMDVWTGFFVIRENESQSTST